MRRQLPSSASWCALAARKPWMRAAARWCWRKPCDGVEMHAEDRQGGGDGGVEGGTPTEARKPA